MPNLFDSPQPKNEINIVYNCAADEKNPVVISFK